MLFRSLVPASIISFIVQEREENLKHQQLISGVSLVAYWVSNGVMDIFKSLIPCGISIAMIYAFSVSLPSAWLLILIYGFTIIPFTYVMSFIFMKENVAQTGALLFNFFAGIVLSPVFTILRLFDSTRMIAKVLCWVFRFIPSFSLAYGINNISYKVVYAFMEGNDVKDNLHFSVAGADLMYLILLFPACIALIFMIESQWFNCLLKCCEPKKSDESKVAISKHDKKHLFVLCKHHK